MLNLNASTFISNVSQDHEMTEAATHNQEDLQQLYNELWDSLTKQVAQRLLEDMLRDWQRQAKAERGWFSFLYSSPRLKMLNKDIEKFQAEYKKLIESTSVWSLDRFFTTVSADFNATFMDKTPYNETINWLGDFVVPNSSQLNTKCMTTLKLTALENQNVDWAEPIVHATKSAAQNLTKYATSACQQSLAFEPLHRKFTVDIPDYSRASDEAKQKLEQSCLQVSYKQLKPKIATKSVKKAGPSNISFAERDDLKKSIFYKAVARYLNQDDGANFDSNSIRELIEAHAKKKGWFSFNFRPDQKTTLLRLVESAEKAELSEKEWGDVERRLLRLNTYVVRPVDAYSAIQPNDNITLEAWFRGARYGRPEAVFKDTSITTSLLEKISHREETTAYVERFKTDYALEGEENDLEKILAAARKKDNEASPRLRTYSVPQDPSEMMRQLYFILTQYYRGQIKSAAEINSVTGVVSFCSEEDKQLYKLVKSELQFAFPLLLLVKSLTFIKGDYPEVYNNLRNGLLNYLANPSDLEFASIDFGSNSGQVIAWLKQYLPTEKMALPSNVQDIIVKLQTMLPLQPIFKKVEKRQQNLLDIDEAALEKIANEIAPASSKSKVSLSPSKSSSSDEEIILNFSEMCIELKKKQAVLKERLVEPLSSSLNDRELGCIKTAASQDLGLLEPALRSKLESLTEKSDFSEQERQTVSQYLVIHLNRLPKPDWNSVTKDAVELMNKRDVLSSIGKKVRLPYTSQEQEIYLLCWHYLAARGHGKGTWVSAGNQHAAVVKYCEDVMAAIEIGAAVPSPASCAGFSTFKESFSGKKLLSHIQRCLAQSIVERKDSKESVATTGESPHTSVAGSFGSFQSAISLYGNNLPKTPSNKGAFAPAYS